MAKIIWLILLLAFNNTVQAQNDKKLVMKGNEWYKKQQYDKAIEEYRKASDVNAKNPATSYNLGNALYKTKKTEEAEKMFEKAAENAGESTGKSKANYNKGVALTRQNKLLESIAAYKDALRLVPTDEEARQNLQRALNELKKQQQQPKNDQKKEDKNKQKPNEQPENKSKLNQKQAEQMLNALRQEEKKLQRGVQKRNNTGGANSKDW